MYLDPTFTTGAQRREARGRSEDKRLELELLTQVRSAWPDLRIGTVRLEQSGGDHLLLIADETWAFRFPRAGGHDLRAEIGVLAALQRSETVETPRYELIEPHERFIGYRFIKGVPLTPVRFGRLPAAERMTLLAEVVRFLRILHRIDPSTICPASAWPRSWSPAQFAARALDQRLPMLATLLPMHADAIEAFLQRFTCIPQAADSVVHGDLVSEHILVGRETGKLAGIIDFADVALGDPAQDLAAFWAYGREAATYAVAAYAAGAGDPGLGARALAHYARQRIDWLFDQLEAGSTPEVLIQPVAELGTLLDPSLVYC